MISVRIASITRLREKRHDFLEESALLSFIIDEASLNNDKAFASQLGKALIRSFLIEEGLNDETLATIRNNNYGKPELPNSDFDFNLSHSNDIVVAAFSHKKEIGIDVEAIKPINIQEYKNELTSKEWEHLLNASNPQVAFFELWTKKESLLKAYGIGLQADLRSANVFDNTGYFRNTQNPGYFTKIDIPNYVCHLCATFSSHDLDIKWVE